MQYQTTSKRILGIDPGIANCGWCVVIGKRSGKYEFLEGGVITTAVSLSEGARLLKIYQQVSELLHLHCPNHVAIERVFHNKNISSSLSTAASIGVIELAVEQSGIVSRMFTPQQVKVSVCGHGGADKKSVKVYLEKLIGRSIRNSHVADACACAIAGYLTQRACERQE